MLIVVVEKLAQPQLSKIICFILITSSAVMHTYLHASACNGHTRINSQCLKLRTVFNTIICNVNILMHTIHYTITTYQFE